MIGWKKELTSMTADEFDLLSHFLLVIEVLTLGEIMPENTAHLQQNEQAFELLCALYAMFP